VKLSHAFDCSDAASCAIVGVVRFQRFAMSDNVQIFTLEILRGVQESISVLRSEMLARFDESHQRFDRIESQMKRIRRDNLGALLITRSTAGALTERMDAMQERVSAIESGRRPT
jgi:hypothetical protein